MELEAAAARALLVACFLTACAEPNASHGDYHEQAPESPGAVTSLLLPTDPVSAVVDDGCALAPLMPLSTQLVEEIDCMSPGALVDFHAQLGDGIAAGSSVFPFLQSFAVDSLAKVIAARGTTLQLNSGLRTLPQQFVLYRWYQLGLCDITLAATPGTSNHESGLAVDVQDNAGWRPFFLAEGWHWQGATDPVHYDIAGGVDLSGLSIEAFQRVWNRNHPQDLVEEDGLYGDETEGRLMQSPIGGFPIGAVCDAGGAGGAAGSGSSGAAGGGTAGTGGTDKAAGTGGAGAAGSAGSSSTAQGGSSVEPPGTAGAGATPPLSAASANDSGGCSLVGPAPSRGAAWLALLLLVCGHTLRRRSGARG